MAIESIRVHASRSVGVSGIASAQLESGRSARPRWMGVSLGGEMIVLSAGKGPALASREDDVVDGAARRGGAGAFFAHGA